MVKKVKEVKPPRYQVYVGWDPREEDAFNVCAYSIQKHASIPVEIIKLDKAQLIKSGIYKRPEPKGDSSTAFAYTRFLVPYLSNFKGWSVFMDCDMVVKSDIAELFSLADPEYAVRVVRHPQYESKRSIKMDGQAQSNYPRKNWSSVILFNNAHQYNKVLIPDHINDPNKFSGAYLHRFSWLNDQFIGPLPANYNYLCDEGLYPNIPLEQIRILHYTLGGPWFKDRPECLDCEYNYVWHQYKFELDGGRTDIPTSFFADLRGLEPPSEGSKTKLKLSIKELEAINKVKTQICKPCRQKK